LPELLEGKAPHNLLSKICKKTGYHHASIVHGPFPGFDVGTLDLAKVTKDIQEYYEIESTPYLTYKADPITFPTSDPARSLIIVNQNDLATAGSKGYAMTITMLFPLGTKENDVLKIQKNLDETAKNHKITILGGHSEVTSTVKRVVLSGSFIGFVPPEYYIGRNAKPGDKIICSGWIGAEGTGIILEEGKKSLKPVLSKRDILRGREIGRDISITNRVLSLNKKFHNDISMIHDITEGGFTAAIYESLSPLGLGAEINKEMLPISPITDKICESLEVDPISLIGSGAVLVFTKPKNIDNIIRTLEKSNKPAKIIGEVTGDPEIYLGDQTSGMPRRDSIIKALRNICETS
jgi:hydrogenase maturation factor